MNVNEWVASVVDGRKIVAVSNGKPSMRVSKRVDTMRGVQHHWGYYGDVWVTFEGQRKPERFRCHFHLKPRVARQHAEKMARAFRRVMDKQDPQ